MGTRVDRVTSTEYMTPCFLGKRLTWPVDAPFWFLSLLHMDENGSVGTRQSGTRCQVTFLAPPQLAFPPFHSRSRELLCT